MLRFIVISISLIISNVYSYPLDSFELKNTPIDIFSSWAADQTGKNIILGKGVQGEISVSVNSLDNSEVLSLFTKVMSAYGFQSEEVGNDLIVTVNANSLASLPKLHAKVYPLKHIVNNKALELFKVILSSQSEAVTGSQSDTKSTPAFSRHTVDSLVSSNSLLVVATKDQLTSLDHLVDQIDVNSKQVLIQAIVFEVDVSKQKDIGVKLGTSLSNSGFTIDTSTGVSSSSISSLSIGSFLPLGSGGNISSLISALAASEETNILSTPNILVLDRELGSLSVGENIPILVSTQTTDGGVQTQSIERKDVGVSLFVTPYILGSGDVILKIQQESSSITTNVQARDIVTNKRSISTSARVASGEIIALGGLISTENRTSVSGVPVLMNVPLLGNLFKSKSEIKVQKELIVFLKTEVI